MKRRFGGVATCGLALFAVLGIPHTATGATLTVGVGKTYAKPCDAIAAAQPNDVVEVDAGTYTDTCAINVAGLTVRGVGGKPKIDLSAGTPAQQKGIYVINADGVTLENLELTGAHIDANSGENGAGIRIQATNLTVRGCFIHDNQDGILGAPAQTGGTLLIESSEFAHNGLGAGCTDGNGCTHNLYIGAGFDKVTFQYNYSHSLATDTPDKGHLFKSRAQSNFVLYNRFTGEGDTDSYEIELPQGGLAVVVGNMVEKSATSGNGSLVAYGLEGLVNPDSRIFVANNTFVDDKSGGTFLQIAGGATLTAHNNLFVGGATLSSTGPLSADNLVAATPMFVDQPGFDYHLTAGSPGIDQGVDPGMADAFSLKPVEEYVHPLGHVPRKDDGKLDLGAFELGTNTMGTGGAGSTSSTSTGTGTGAASGTGSASTGAGGGNGSGGSSDGCSCKAAGDGRESGGALLAVLGVAAFAASRRCARRG